MSGGRDRTIRLWNPHKGSLIQAYKGKHGYEVLDVRITADKKNFASAGGDKVCFLWDVAEAKTIHTFRGHDLRVNTLGFNAECNVLASGSYDKTVKLWDCRGKGRDPIQVLSDFTDSVTSVVIYEHQLLTGCVDGKLRTYDLRMGTLTTDHICQAMTHLSLSNDGHCVLLSCLDNFIRLFDKRTGELLAEYSGHTNKSYKIESCFNENDAYVVSGSEDCHIYFWSLVEAERVHVLKGHAKEVVSLAYHPKQSLLVSASTDGTIKCWT